METPATSPAAKARVLAGRAIGWRNSNTYPAPARSSARSVNAAVPAVRGWMVLPVRIAPGVPVPGTIEAVTGPKPEPHDTTLPLSSNSLTTGWVGKACPGGAQERSVVSPSRVGTQFVFDSKVTAPEYCEPVARSVRPSPFQSAATIPLGWPPTTNPLRPNPPAPSAANTKTAFEPGSATARSDFPSPLRSAATTGPPGMAE